MRDKLKKAFDPSSAKEVLQKGIAKGLWTLEDLDTPTQGYLLSTGQKWNSITEELEWKNDRTRLGHMSAIPKHQIPPYRNLLRDTEPVETVQASADPRDFDPRPVPDVRPDSSQVLRPEEKEVLPQVSLTDSQQVELSEPLAF